MSDALRLSRRQIILAAAALALPAPPALAAPAPRGGIRIVDGWVLTDRDVAALGLDAG
jgi:hypothetical protein